MGVRKISTGWIRELFGNSWSTGQAYLRGLRARTDIESARTELRLGNVAQCERLLATARQRVKQAGDVTAGSQQEELASQQPPGPEPFLRIVEAVILTLRGQCERLRQSPGDGGELFTRAHSLFAAASSEMLSPRDHGDFGMALTADGQYKEARLHLEAAIAVESAPPEHARELARVYLEANRPNKAEPLIAQALLALPADPELHLLRAMAQQARRKPGAAESFVYAGQLLLNAGRVRAALSAFEQAKVLGTGAAASLRAEALRVLGRNDEALQAFDAAMAADEAPGAWLFVRRAAVRMALDDGDGASTDVERALELEPDSADVLILAGQVRLAQQDHEAAIRLATQALATEPGSWEALLLEARARRDGGDLGGALDLVRSANADALSHPDVLTLHADMALAAGLPEEAIERLERLQGTPRADAEDAARYAAVLADNGRPDEAWTVTTHGLAVWPGHLGLRIMEARLALTRGDREASRAKALELATLAPDSATAQLLKAAALLATDPPWDEQTRTAALAAAERSAELDHRSAEPWWIRAQVLRDAGDDAGTRKALDEALARDPRHRKALRLAVELDLPGEDLDRTEELAHRLLSEAPDDVENMVLLAQALSRHRKYDEALSLLRDPRVESAGEPAERAARLLVRAWIQVDMRKLADAAKDLETAAGLDSGRADIWTERAAVARQLGDAESAKRYAEKALTIADGDVSARTELAAARLMRDEGDQAEHLLEELEREQPDDVRVGLLHVQAVAARSPEQAERELARLASAHPDDLAVVYARARFDLDMGEYDKALSLLETVPDGDWKLDILALRAEAYRLLARPDEAIRDATRCLEQAPEHEDALATLGLTLLETGRCEEAVTVLEHASDAYPNNPLVQARLGQGYVTLDRYPDALRVLDAAAVAAPGSAWVIARLADVVSAIGLYDASAALCQRAVSRDEGNAASWNGLGWSLENQDPPKLEQAETAYRRAVDLDRNLWSRQNLANVLFARHQRAEASEILREALTEALARRGEHIDYLSLAGWCYYKLGDLAAAARSLYEVTSAQKQTGGEHFDLALVHACDQRIHRAVGLYESIIPLDDRDEQRRRGLLTVAMADLRQATDDYPHLAESPQIDGILSLMARTIQAVPAAPEIRALGKVPATGR
jgi:tetratricopeptide (TPR) repeat protein